MSVPRWLARVLYALRGRRLVRLHLVDPHPTVEGVLVGRWSGHYILLLPKIVQDEGKRVALEGELEVPADRVVFVQVIRS